MIAPDDRSFFNKARALAAREEGLEAFAYDDRTGKRVVAPVGKLTIGIGWNVQDNGIPAEVIELLFQISYDRALSGARNVFPNFNNESENRRLAMWALVFQIGESALLTKWHETPQAINDRRWGDAADLLKKTKLGRIDAPKRTERLAWMLANDILPDFYTA